MALAFPVPLESFFADLPVQFSEPELTESYEMNETGYGEILTADLGTRLWQMKVSVRDGSYREIERVRARLNMLRQAGRTLIAHAIPGAFPQHDPNGSILGSNAPTLSSVAANMRDIRITGLPSGYRIYDGDYLSFQYGSNPVRYAFHQAIIPVVGTPYVQATTAGLTPAFEVTPNIRPGYATGAAVQLLRPRFKAMIVPNSTNLGRSGQQQTTGISFTLMQTLRN